MSWFRIEGRMPHHRKIAPLSDAAFRLHITAGCWSVEERTEGMIPEAIPATLPAAPRGKALKRTVAVLLECGAWERVEGGYQIHDFLAYNLSNAQAEAKARAGKAGGKRSGQVRRSKNEARASHERSATKQVLKQNGTKLEAETESESETQERSPPTPQQLRGLGLGLPRQRDDVRQLHTAWRTVTGKAGHKLSVGEGHFDAKRLADAIDAHGLSDCLLVVHHCMRDGKVNGRLDERGEKHDSIRYLFENQETFARILRDAQKASKERASESAVDAYERAISR